MLGYTEDELRGLTVNDLDVNEEPEDTRQRIEMLRKEGAGRFVTRHRRKDGTLIDVEVSVSFVATGGDHMVAFVRDVSDRKRVEAEREITLHLLRLLSTPNGLHELLTDVTLLMRDWSGCEAVGVRLQEVMDACYRSAETASPVRV